MAALRQWIDNPVANRQGDLAGGASLISRAVSLGLAPDKQCPIFTPRAGPLWRRSRVVMSDRIG